MADSVQIAYTGAAAHVQRMTTVRTHLDALQPSQNPARRTPRDEPGKATPTTPAVVGVALASVARARAHHGTDVAHADRAQSRDDERRPAFDYADALAPASRVLEARGADGDGDSTTIDRCAGPCARVDELVLVRGSLVCADCARRGAAP
jgi:hypothetical protein